MSAPLLAHDDRGHGPSVALFVHAFPLDRRMWRRQLDLCASLGVRAIAPDLRGFGESSAQPLTTVLDDHADDLAALLDGLGVARAALIGLSMGGYVALAFARRHPRRLSGLLLSDTRATADSPQAREGRGGAILKAMSEGSAAVFDAMRPKALPEGSSPAAIEELRAIAASQRPEGVVAALSMMRDRPDSTPVLSTIAVPTWVVGGVRDELTPIAELRALSEAIPGARFVAIDGAGHFPQIEAPDAFAEPLRALLEVSR